MTVLTDGAVVDQLAYDGFGRLTYESNPSAGDRFSYTGRERDPVTSLQYNRGRYYDTLIGSWTEQDPTGIAAGDSNFNRYAGNDPVNNSDPSGLRMAGLDGEGNPLRTPRGVPGNGPDERDNAMNGLSNLLGDLTRPGFITGLPAAVGDTFQNGQAADGFTGLVDGATSLNPFGGGTSFGPVYGHQDDYDNGRVIGVAAAKLEVALAAPAAAGAGLCAVGALAAEGTFGAAAATALPFVVAGVKAWSAANNGYQAGANLASAYDNFQNGKQLTAIGNLFAAAQDVWAVVAMTGSCFAAGTPVRTPAGHCPVQDVRVGQAVLTRAEGDPDGPVLEAIVTETFSRLQATLTLRIEGREVRTTAEHPFWVEGRGWTPAGRIETGDRLRAERGPALAVEAVTRDSREW